MLTFVLHAAHGGAGQLLPLGVGCVVPGLPVLGVLCEVHAQAVERARQHRQGQDVLPLLLGQPGGRGLAAVEVGQGELHPETWVT